jgi:hypothetical protein
MKIVTERVLIIMWLGIAFVLLLFVTPGDVYVPYAQY